MGIFKNDFCSLNFSPHKDKWSNPVSPASAWVGFWCILFRFFASGSYPVSSWVYHNFDQSQFWPFSCWYFLGVSHTLWDLSSQPEIEHPVPPAVKTWSPDYWTTRNPRLLWLLISHNIHPEENRLLWYSSVVFTWHGPDWNPNHGLQDRRAVPHGTSSQSGCECVLRTKRLLEAPLASIFSREGQVPSQGNDSWLFSTLYVMETRCSSGWLLSVRLQELSTDLVNSETDVRSTRPWPFNGRPLLTHQKPFGFLWLPGRH